MDFDLMVTSIPRLLEGAVVTLQLVSLSLILGMILALPLALCRVSRQPLLWMPVYGYIFYFRGTPLLVQIFLTYYGLGQFEAVRESFLWPVLREAYWCAIIAFTMNTAAYTAEILRGGILAVPAGEIEAARAVGMSRWLLYRRIILPRAIRMALPAYSNEVILMLKASALASTITLLDLTGVARIIVARSFAPYELFLTAGVIYLLMTFVVTRAFKQAEYRLSPHLRPPPV
ncbi:MAG: ABC transporter permease [Alphaproteobacteria bacterium]|nr:ABC transporter permease [Rhodospirillaceae bacterium]MDP6404389.1 ABC transporter permease [Alphaproteobacteria bacterium]MDP6621326.1 ABC transporter permease [Alphaproteobacteria bacterium]